MRNTPDGTALPRPMRPEDAARVAALIRAAFIAQPVELDPPPSALRVTASPIEAHLARPGCGGAVVELEGMVVGSILWEPTEAGLGLSRLAVAPAWRRRGIGRALLDAAEAAARAGGLERMRLGTRLALSGNRRLFAASGFAETVLHSHPGSPIPTWVEMEKRLG
jgi:predicted N-acetyltransferase YhbS